MQEAPQAVFVFFGTSEIFQLDCNHEVAHWLMAKMVHLSSGKTFPIVNVYILIIIGRNRITGNLYWALGDFSPGNPNRENQHILYSYIVYNTIYIWEPTTSKTLTQ
jgi:hypothetical protein